jgi:hypothetical protein
MQERTFVYCRPAVRNDHWDKEHLEGKQCAAQRGHMISCDHPKCKEAKAQLETLITIGITLRRSTKSSSEWNGSIFGQGWVYRFI